MAGSFITVVMLLFVSNVHGADEEETIPVAKTGDTFLFIGNSFTYANNLPAVFEAMAGHARKKIRTEMIAEGGASFGSHWNNSDTRQAAEKKKWNFVILQDQSQTPVFIPEDTMKYGANFCKAVKENGGVPVLFVTWGYLEDGSFDTEMQDGLTATYSRLAAQENALLVPVGEVWRAWYKTYPKTVLHSSDGRHPNEYGTYLAACVFYATLFQKSPEGLPGRLRLNGRVVSSIPDDIAKKMQKLVADFQARERQ